VAVRRYSLQKHNKARRKKSSAQTDDEYQRKVEVWQAQQPLDVELQVKGNSMTQAYYTRHILPHHINRIKQLQQRYQRTVFLQEDNDPSHGNRSYNNVAARLNPIESIWQVVSQRLRGSSWSTVKEFKEAIQAEWRKVTLSELRKRIAEMPWRCERVIELEGR
jgi:hypothetical protein